MKETQSTGQGGWSVVAAGFVCLTVAAGVGFYVFPVFLGSIQEEFGWSLTRISVAITLWGFAGAIFSPLCGRWIDSYGTRKVMVFGTLCQFAATILLSQISVLWHLYAVMVLSSIGNICNTYVPVAAVIAKWFDERRGTATGVAMLGLGCGGFVMPLLANQLLENYGWRTGYFALSFCVLGLLVPILLWIREPAQSDTADTDTDDSAPADQDTAGDDGADLRLGQAVRTRSFWGVGVGDAITGLVFAIFNVQLVFFLTEAGFQRGTATAAFATFLLCLSLGTALFGGIADRVSLRGLMLFCYALPAVATVCLFPSGIVALPFVFAFVCGAAGGGRSALFPLALAHCFGTAHMGAIYGLSNSLFLIGNSLGPLIGGIIYDQTGSSQGVYVLAIVLFIGSVALISVMRNERTRFAPD